jgi:hypothetical protein
MDTTNDRKAPKLPGETLDRALQLVAFRLKENGSRPLEIVVCGGSALILTGAVTRTTRDVDIVALMRDGVLCSPDPLPDQLIKAANEVAEDMGLAPSWLNNGPSREPAGLLQIGLPVGLENRLTSRSYGPCLTVHFVGRLDLIHFKVFAAVDRAGYDVDDLLALNPEDDEIESAARWAMTQDISGGFAIVLKDMLRKLGYEKAAERI